MENEKDIIMYFSLKHKIQVFNRTDTPKIIRDFKVTFIKDKKMVHSLVPNNETTRVYTSYSSRVDEMEVSNIMPREIQVLEHSGYVNEELLYSIEGCNKIELVYYDDKDKKRIEPLYKGLVSKSTYQSKNR